MIITDRHLNNSNYNERRLYYGIIGKEKELVAIGAAFEANCIPCLEWHYKKSTKLGFSKQDMQEAIAMAKKVKKVPTGKIYETAAKLSK